MIQFNRIEPIRKVVNWIDDWIEYVWIQYYESNLKDNNFEYNELYSAYADETLAKSYDL